MIASCKYFIHSNIQKDIYGNQSLAFCNICCRGLHISDNIEVPNIFSVKNSVGCKFFQIERKKYIFYSFWGKY